MKESTCSFLFARHHLSRLVVCCCVMVLSLDAEETIEELKQKRLHLHELLVDQMNRDYSDGITGLNETAKAQRGLVKLKRELEVDYQDDLSFYSKLLEIEERQFRLMERNYRAGDRSMSSAMLQKSRLRVLKYKQRILESKLSEE